MSFNESGVASAKAKSNIINNVNRKSAHECVTLSPPCFLQFSLDSNVFIELQFQLPPVAAASLKIIQFVAESAVILGRYSKSLQLFRKCVIGYPTSWVSCTLHVVVLPPHKATLRLSVEEDADKGPRMVSPLCSLCCSSIRCFRIHIHVAPRLRVLDQY